MHVAPHATRSTHSPTLALPRCRRRCNRLEEVNVGVAGVAAAVLLAVCAPTAPLLLAAGGAGHVSAAGCGVWVRVGAWG